MSAPIKPTIKYADFARLDVRVGTIRAAEPKPGTDNLVRLTVHFGDHTRNVLAGIAQEREDVTEIVGKQALFVVNMEPRNIMGEVSEGMLFDLGYEDGITPCLAVPETPVPDGTRAG